MIRIKIFVSILLFLVYVNVYSQQKETIYRAETFGSLAIGDNTPFWLLNHTWGMIPLNSNNIYLRGGIFHEQELNRNWSFSLGLDLSGASSHVYNTFWIQQIYGIFNWKSLQLKLGAKEDYVSLLDERLSSGDLNFSNNTRPAPEFRIAINDFTPIPDTEDLFYIKGDFAVGRYLDGGYQEDKALPSGHKYAKNVLFHHKSLFFRIGNIEKRTKIQFVFGLDNYAQWGGDVYIGGVKYKMSRSLRDFIRVFFAEEGGGSSLLGDKLHIAGNQTGTYLAKVDYILKEKDIFSIYWQHYFEDESGLTLDNYPDMLLGLQYKSKEKRLFSGILFEYLYTKHQSGPIHFNLNMGPSHSYLQEYGFGMDNYYNHIDYVQGKSYYGRALGNPLLLSPEYNEKNELYFRSNRVIALHTGVEGYLDEDFEYYLLMTYGKSWGRYDMPYIKPEAGFAGALHVTYHHPNYTGLDFKFSLGLNSGKYFGTSTTGIGITITKTGIVPD